MAESILFDNIASGLLAGGQFIQLRKTENTIRTGANVVTSSLCQVGEVAVTCTFVKEIAKTVNGPTATIPLSLRVTSFVLPVVPVVIAVLLTAKSIHKFAKEKLSSGNIIVKTFAWLDTQMDKPMPQKIVQAIHENLGRVTEIISAVSCVALIILGNVATGGIGVAFIALGFSMEKGWVPASVRRIVNEVTPYSTLFASFFVGNIFEQAIAVAVVAGDLVNKVIKWREKRELDTLPERLKQEISQTGLSKLNFYPKLKVNRAHVDVASILSKEPELDLKKEVSELAKGIDWNSEDVKKRVDATVKNDERWQKYLKAQTDAYGVWKTKKVKKKGKTVTEKYVQFEKAKDTYESRKKYLLWGLERFSKKIIDKKILEGEPLDYSPLRIMAKQNIEKIKSLKKEEQLSYLVNMGLSSYYCGSGIFRAVQGDNLELCGVQNASLENKLHASLSQLREQIFHKFYHKLTDNPFSQALDANDIHNYDTFVNLYGNDFALPQKVIAQNDQTIGDSPIANMGIKKLFYKLHEAMDEQDINPFEIPWVDYNQYRIVRHIREAIATQQIPEELVSEWFLEWSKREALKTYPDENSAEFMKKRMELNEELLDWEGNYTNGALYILLGEFGIFEMPEGVEVKKSDVKSLGYWEHAKEGILNPAWDTVSAYPKQAYNWVGGLFA